MSEMKVEIEESPYGDKGKTYSGFLGMTNHWIMQLKSFRSPTKTKEESDYLEADIRGYEEILKSGQEQNAVAFMTEKHEAMRKGRRHANNEEIVKYLKETKRWID